VLRNNAVGEPQRAVHQVAQGEDVPPRGRLVNGSGEGREDRARVSEGHGADPREVQQDPPVEATEHDAEVPLRLPARRSAAFRQVLGLSWARLNVGQEAATMLCAIGSTLDTLSCLDDHACNVREPRWT